MAVSRAGQTGAAAATLVGVLALLWLNREPASTPRSEPLSTELASDVATLGELAEEWAGSQAWPRVDRGSLEALPVGMRWRARDQSSAELAPLPRAGSEKALHAAYLEQARTDAEDFRRVCSELLSNGSTLAEKAAALRAWYDAGLQPRYQAFALALSEPSTETELREFAMRFLGRKAHVDGAARQALFEYLVAGSADARGRYLALYPVLRWGDDREVSACVELLFADRDLSVVVRAAGALRLSSARNAPAILRDLRQGHPRADVRRALASARDNLAN